MAEGATRREAGSTRREALGVVGTERGDVGRPRYSAEGAAPKSFRMPLPPELAIGSLSSRTCRLVSRPM